MPAALPAGDSSTSRIAKRSGKRRAASVMAVWGSLVFGKISGSPDRLISIPVQTPMCW
ncbi:hypothetical protein D3C81_817540 [compost metagenome]